MGTEPCANYDAIEAAVETAKARIIAALDAMSPAEVRQLVSEIETEMGQPLKDWPEPSPGSDVM